jgi:hypothetical protein
MTDTTLIASVCRLPISVRVHTDRSLAQLLEDARQAGHGVFPTEGEIAAELTAHPELVEPWIQLSENQRVSAGWYLRRPRAGAEIGWEVGYYPSSASETYSNGISAAAAFICRYIGSVDIR